MISTFLATKMNEKIDKNALYIARLEAVSINVYFSFGCVCWGIQICVQSATM